MTRCCLLVSLFCPGVSLRSCSCVHSLFFFAFFESDNNRGLILHIHMTYTIYVKYDLYIDTLCAARTIENKRKTNLSMTSFLLSLACLLPLLQRLYLSSPPCRDPYVPIPYSSRRYIHLNKPLFFVCVQTRHVLPNHTSMPYRTHCPATPLNDDLHSIHSCNHDHHIAIIAATTTLMRSKTGIRKRLLVSFECADMNNSTLEHANREPNHKITTTVERTLHDMN